MPNVVPETIHRDALYTSREVRKRLRIGDVTWRQMRMNGLRTTRLGKVVVVEGAELIRYCSSEANSNG